MKKIVILPLILLIFSCDKVDRPIENKGSTVLDETLYPGSWSDYPWPTFEQNTNTNRNILLEDYTGHTCVYCPAAADVAHQLEEENASRLFVASIHASPGGIGDFQKLEPPTFVHDFTTPEGIQYGVTFEDGYGFVGNPRGTINRMIFSDYMFQPASNWANIISTVLTENQLKVNLQSKINFFETTRGLFLHTEIDPKETPPDSIQLVTYFIENDFVAPQKKNGEGTIMDYHHHNVHRGNLDGLAFGRKLDETYKREDGLYQIDISYKIPEAYTAANCHVLVYAMNPKTYEIYQVIKVLIE
ncbi:MAG: Omp28-related outer membrane protein [Flavobacteriia bacterium]|nr:Omp28-related outer membrane protein [Flavobacteriia bacterium]